MLEWRRMVLRGGLGLVGLSVALGLAIAVLSTRLLSRLLYGVGPLDPRTLLTVIVLLTAVAVLACYLPARRASRVQPADALRIE
jgi:ABC-type antimicrobial peptide transport system permease subunit